MQMSVMDTQSNSHESNQSIGPQFRMSKKTYNPKEEEKYQEELQKSIMGVSFKMIQGSQNLRESIIATPRKMSAPPTFNVPKKETNKMFNEFFIIGSDYSKITQQDMDSEVPIDPTNLYMYIDNSKSSDC